MDREIRLKLNELANNNGLTWVRKTTSVSDIIKRTFTKNPDDLRYYVNSEIAKNPNCVYTINDKRYRAKSITDLGKLLYMFAQEDLVPVNLQECITYVDNTFVIKTLSGFEWEEKILNWLQHKKPEARYSTSEEDSKFAIDLIVPNEFAIQVKPQSYKNFDMHWEMNKRKNNNFSLPVYYVYYNNWKKNVDIPQEIRGVFK